MMSVEGTVEIAAPARALFSGAVVRATPVTLTQARLFVARLHRHNKPPLGGLWAHGAAVGAKLVGVAIVGRPIARMLDDGWTVEVTRLCTDGTRNACSQLYSAAARVAREKGYRKIITYTLATEPGVSLRAAGWTLAAEVKGAASWSRPSRERLQQDMFGEHQRPQGDKLRWEKTLRPPQNDGAIRRAGASEAGRDLPADSTQQPESLSPNAAYQPRGNSTTEHQ